MKASGCLLALAKSLKAGVAQRLSTVDGVPIREAEGAFNPDLRVSSSGNPSAYIVDMPPGARKRKVAYDATKQEGKNPALTPRAEMGSTTVNASYSGPLPFSWDRALETTHTLKAGEVYAIGLKLMTISGDIDLYPLDAGRMRHSHRNPEQSGISGRGGTARAKRIFAYTCRRRGTCMKKGCFLFFHDWDGCACSRCGKTRDRGHDWDGCVCKRCGGENHDWRNGCVCARCGKIRNRDHEWDADDRYCLRCGAEKIVESGVCSYCNGLGADPATYSQQSGQGGSNFCPVCHESGCEVTVTVVMKQR